MACALGIEQDCKECGLCGNSPTWRYKMAKCKYPNEICANMTVYHGVAYCDSVPCSLKDELPKRTNYEKIKGMSVEELAEFLVKVNTAYAEPCMTGETDCKWEDYPTHDKGCKNCFKEWLESECDAE